MTAWRGLTVAAAAAALVAPAAPDGSPPSARAEDAGPGTWFCTQLLWSPEAVNLVAAGPDGSVVFSSRDHPSPHPDGDANPGFSLRKLPFVTKYGADGERLWSTWVPLRPAPGVQDVSALRVAANGSVWATGRGTLAGVPRALPDLAGDRSDDEAWVVRWTSDGTLSLAVHLGGSDEEEPTSLVVTPDGDAVVAGITWSTDFAAVAPFQAVHGGGGTDAFVARVRADGSGVAWASLLGSSAPEGSADLAARPSGDFFAVVHPVQYTDADPVRLVRISAEGALLGDELLPHGTTTPDVGSPFRLAVAPDGAVLAAATNEFSGGTWGVGRRAFVLRRPPEGGPAEVRWSAARIDAGRIAVTPAGDVLLGSWNGSATFSGDRRRERSLRILRGDPLVATDVLAERDGTWSVADFDVSPDGAIWAVGSGPVPAFGAQSAAPHAGEPFLVRLPSTVPALEARCRLGRAGRRDVTLHWSSPGDVPERWVVEHFADSNSWKPVASLPGSGRSARVGGLPAGADHEFRLVAEYGSGLRLVACAATAYTRPEAPHRVAALENPTFVAVRWVQGNGGGVRFQVQRRVGGGPWRPVDMANWDPAGGHYGELRDPLPRVPGLPVVYRVRTVLDHPGGRWVSRWTESRPVRSAPR